MGRRGSSSHRGTGRGNGAQATGTSTKNESKSKQEKDLVQNVTDKRNRKMKEKEKSIVDSPAPMSTRARTANDKKKAGMDSKKPACDKKVVDKLEGNAFSKQGLDNKKRKMVPEAPIEVPKMESPVVADSVGNKSLSGKPGHSNEKAFLACASPLSAEIENYSQISELLQIVKQDVIAKQKRNLDPLVVKVLEVLALENEKEIEAKSKIDESKHRLQYSKGTHEIKPNFDVKTSKVEQEQPSEKEKGNELKTVGNESLSQCAKGIDQIKLNLDLEASKMKKEFSSEKEKAIEAKYNVDELTPMLQFSQDIDERKLNLKSPKMKQGHSSEIKKKENESYAEGNTFTAVVAESSKDIDDQKANFDLKDSKEQQKLSSENEKEITVAKLEVDKSTQSQDSKLVLINEKMQNIDLNSSITKHISSENENKLMELETEQHEEIINLRKDVNLRFKFDTLNINVLVDNKDCYTANKNQKITFNIGDGNVKLSFIDNKVCIFAQRGEIDCSIRKNQIIFSLKDNFILSDSSPEAPPANEQFSSKDTNVENLSSTNITETTKEPSLDHLEETHQEQEYENIQKSTMKTDSSLETSSLAQRRIQNMTENFLAKIASSCEDYEMGFIECLKKGNKESPEK
ncbi:unnamed protein product [Larinioides sclopetarius]|uniref:Uncharacterized protein n=1 Tax=Larinioides sclopetarius TaxID=280406 RepID=A0AAV2BLZ2_9ARAC